MVVKTKNFSFFPPVAEFRIGILIFFANPFRGNGMDLYSRHIMAAISRDAARYVSTSGCPAAAVKTPSPSRLERPKITNVTFGTRL
jgi:hypothetical protein